MLVKSLVAGTVLTLLAGGVVYYGTDLDGNISVKSAVENTAAAVSETVDKAKDVISKDDEAISKDDSSSIEVAKDEHPHSKKEAASESSSDIPSIKTTENNLIDPKAAAVKENNHTDDKAVESEIIAELESDIQNELDDDPAIKSEDHDSIKLAQADETETDQNNTPEENPKPTRKWIDQYLKPAPETNQESVQKPAQVTEDAPEIQEASVTEVEANADKSKSMEDMDATTSVEKPMDENKVAVTSLDAMVDQELDRVLLSEAGIQEAETKGFDNRAKDIENIWTTEKKTETETETETEADPKTLHDIMKEHDDMKHEDGETKNVEIEVITDEHGTTTIETETIDLGDGKVIKTVKKKHISDSDHGNSHDTKSYGSGSKENKSYGSGSSEHETGKKKMRIKVMTNDGFDGDENLPEIINMRNGKKIKIRKKMHNDPKDKVHMDSENSSKNAHEDISETASLIMEQAEKISIPELRDRAYLDLVSYALDHGDKAAAALALSKIEQVELRDTARNRMAVAYAKAGKAKKAFAILDDLEVEALRDVMRLQVIEALIVPENEPPLEAR